MSVLLKRAGLLAVVGVMLLGVVLPAMAQTPAGRELQVTSDEVVLEFETVAGDFFQPIQVVSAHDGSGRLFVVERLGTVRIVENGQVLPEPFLDVEDQVLATSGERGFFSIAFHPDFADNGYFYAHYTSRPDGNVVISRFEVSDEDPNRFDPESEFVLLSVDHPHDIHNGGGLKFGLDGYLYITIGDGGGPVDGDPEGDAQNLNSLLGKVLRIDVDGGDPYAIPSDNPFVGRNDARPEVWSYGLRNPWRINVDRVTGDLFISDVGSGSTEELNYQPGNDPGGNNYGWPVLEGSRCFPFWVDCYDPDSVRPIIEYEHDLGCSISSAQVYRGEEAAFMQGTLIFGDWCSGRIWMANKDASGAWTADQLSDSGFGITSIEEDENGDLYLTDMWEGQLVKLIFQEVDSGLVIDAIDPPGAIAGSEDLELTVTGSGFTTESVVRWNGSPLPTTFISETELVAVVSGEDLGSLSNVDITITVANGNGTGKVSNAVIFAINAFGNSAFESTWRRTDKVLVDMETERTWIWGPRPITNPRSEDYLESPGNERVVQYFDKSRMEITDPDKDEDDLWYVTNGLLVVEMMSGQIQVGDNTWIEHEPAEINIAGDDTDPNGVTYATFAGLSGFQPIPEGWKLIQTIDRDGTVSSDPSLAEFDITAGPLVEETNHRVASVFWEFMVSEGLIYDGDEQTEGRLFVNPFYATGLPVTEAYWTTVEVAGIPNLVLVQAFERRVLTFTPDNVPEWQVEAGNVGRHYFIWRYGENLLPFNR